MTAAFADIFALACGVAGWFYLFYSKAATRLTSIEPAPRNTLRKILRRACGAAMILLGILCYAGSNTVDDRRNPGAFVAIWIGAMILLILIIALVTADIIFTAKLRSKPGVKSNKTP
jgi:hypothetical protein